MFTEYFDEKIKKMVVKSSILKKGKTYFIDLGRVLNLREQDI